MKTFSRRVDSGTPRTCGSSSSASWTVTSWTSSRPAKNFKRVQMAIVSGFFRNSAKKDPAEGFKTQVDQQVAFVHPSSSLFNRQPEWLIYHEITITTREYMREVTAIDPKWLVEFAPNFFRVADPTRMTKRKRMERIEPLYNRYEEPNAWRISRVRRF